MNKPNDNETSKQFGEAATETKSSCSCCFYGCLLTFLFMTVVVVGGGFSGYWWLQAQLDRYTSDVASDLPTVELSDEELEEIQSRVDSFKETIEGGDEADTLVLTAEEINAMITKDDDMRGRVYITIEEGLVSGDISIPTDFIPGGKGRFFNASATFDVSLEDGMLIVKLTSAEVKGEPVPAQIMDGMSKENLAKDIYDDPDVAAILRRIESIAVEGDTIVLTPKAPGGSPSGEMEIGEETEEGEEVGEETNEEAGEEAEVGEEVGEETNEEAEVGEEAIADGEAPVGESEEASAEESELTEAA